LTKIATAILTVEQGQLDALVEIDVDSGKMAGSSLMGLRPGDEFSVRDLLYGLMLESGNDAALALGRALAGSDASFVAQLNALLARIGLTDSKLLNPHGLDEAGHRTSAYDLAMLARYGMGFEAFREVVETLNWVAEGSRRIVLKNGNAFLGYSGADGVKTGFTTGARETVAASATRGGHRVFVVLLNAPARFAEAGALLDWVFSNFCWPADGEEGQACRPPNG
jgi:D-alanyl-D-alanine carboxypeptidase